MLDKALNSIKESLSYDGFDLLAAEREGGLIDIMIVARHDACIDCLVPKPVLEEMIASALQENGIKYSEIKLTMPVNF
ncbi:MAG: hypothetical protein GX197_08665 [Firmicutes bacterium]|nr:hypothetical protein [Bacillota bacterium]